MTRHRSPQRQPRAVERILATDMERHTIDALLDQGAVVTPHGARTHLRVGEVLKTVPTALYDQVLAERRLRFLDKPSDDLSGWEYRG